MNEDLLQDGSGDLLLASTLFLSPIYHWLKVTNCTTLKLINTGVLVEWGSRPLREGFCMSLLVRVSADTSRITLFYSIRLISLPRSCHPAKEAKIYFT
jgi:hypothetical protein